MPSCNSYRLTRVSLTLGVGYLFTAAPANHSHCSQKRSLVFPILLFSCISLHWSLREVFISLLAILWNSAFRWVYLSLSPLPLASFLFSAVCKISSDNHSCLFAFLFLGMVLITASYTVSRTFLHHSTGTLSDLIP